MRLSEAIRKGAELRPQYHGWYFGDGASCALGAAYEAVAGRYSTGHTAVERTLHESFKATLDASATCPCSTPHRCDAEDVPVVMNVIVDLNDNCKWTREEIADWLAGQGL